jgi:hypothetical protein
MTATETTEASDLLGATPIDVGSALFAMHDPHPGHEKAFGRYYERDHMYSAALLAPFTIAGQRWVATRDLKQLRYPEVGPFGPATAGSYLTMFWIQAGRLAEQQAWVNRQMKSLVEAGRVFTQRDVQTATAYDYLGSMERDEDGVPPFMALDHRYAGFVWVIVERVDDRPVQEVASSLLDTHLATLFAGSPVAIVSAFTPRPKEPWWPAAAPEVAGVGERLALAMFVEGDPRDVWSSCFASLGGAIDATRDARTLLVAPFIPTRPGTDAYADELR